MNTRFLTQDLESKMSTLSLRKPLKMNADATSASRPLPHLVGVGFPKIVHSEQLLYKILGLENLRGLRYCCFLICLRFCGCL